MQEKKDGLKFSYALSIDSQLGFLVVSSIGGFLALGIWFDKIFAVSPLFVIVGIVMGISVTIYEINHLMTPLISSDEKKHD